MQQRSIVALLTLASLMMIQTASTFADGFRRHDTATGRAIEKLRQMEEDEKMEKLKKENEKKARERRAKRDEEQSLKTRSRRTESGGTRRE